MIWESQCFVHQQDNSLKTKLNGTKCVVARSWPKKNQILTRSYKVKEKTFRSSWISAQNIDKCSFLSPSPTSFPISWSRAELVLRDWKIGLGLYLHKTRNCLLPKSHLYVLDIDLPALLSPYDSWPLPEMLNAVCSYQKSI